MSLAARSRALVLVLALVGGCAPAPKHADTGMAANISLKGNVGIPTADLLVAAQSSDGTNDDAELTQRCGAAVELAYAERGWLEAHTKNTFQRETDGSLSIAIKVSEGPRYRVSTVTIDDTLHVGAPIPFTEPALRELVPIRAGEFFRAEAGRTGARDLAEFFHARGVPNASVVPESERDAEHAQIALIFHVERADGADAGPAQ